MIDCFTKLKNLSTTKQCTWNNEATRNEGISLLFFILFPSPSSCLSSPHQSSMYSTSPSEKVILKKDAQTPWWGRVSSRSSIRHKLWSPQDSHNGQSRGVDKDLARMTRDGKAMTTPRHRRSDSRAGRITVLKWSLSTGNERWSCSPGLEMGLQYLPRRSNKLHRCLRARRCEGEEFRFYPQQFLQCWWVVGPGSAGEVVS